MRAILFLLLLLLPGCDPDPIKACEAARQACQNACTPGEESVEAWRSALQAKHKACIAEAACETPGPGATQAEQEAFASCLRRCDPILRELEALDACDKACTDAFNACIQAPPEN